MTDPNEQVKNINLTEENIREFFNNIWGSFLKENWVITRRKKLDGMITWSKFSAHQNKTSLRNRPVID